MTDPTTRGALTADCGECLGLCCVVPALSRSADFAIDKPAGSPCPHLADDARCSIHATLPERGFPGCVVYDCFGAGQRVVADLAATRRTPELEAAFVAVEGLHELLWYLLDAAERDLPRDLAAEVAGATEVVRRSADSPVARDVSVLQGRVAVLLGEVSDVVRRGLGGADLYGADLAGGDLRDRDLYAARLRGAVLIGADLRDQDLGPADLLGADLRNADVRGADLSQALFLTRLQVRATRADEATRWPAWDST